MKRSLLAVVVLGAFGCGASAREAPLPVETPEPRTAPVEQETDLDVDALLGTLRDLVSRKQLGAARARAEEAIARFPDRIEARYAGGTTDAEICKAWAMGGSPQSERLEAVAACTRCIERMSDVIERGGYRHDHYNRGCCHVYLGHDAEAERDFTAGLTSHSDDGDYFAFRAETRARLGRQAEACADAREAVRLGARVDGMVEDFCGTVEP